MARKVTPAQARAAMRRAAQQQKQAIDKHNREVRKFNSAVKKARSDRQRAVNDYNRGVRAYNAKVRTHNAQVKSQRRRLEQETKRLNSRPTSTTFTTYRPSVQVLTRAYTTAEERFSSQSTPSAIRELVDYGSEAAANSVYLLNAMDGDGDPDAALGEGGLQTPSLQAELTRFGQDLVDRWTGALFALSPLNPDAARHFCTSAREVLITMLDQEAPDKSVIAVDPDCEKTDRGDPTRRAKINYLLGRKRIHEDAIEDLIEADLNNVLRLFRDFNGGTHGHAGKFTLTQLTALRIRVESAVVFIHGLCTP